MFMKSNIYSRLFFQDRRQEVKLFLIFALLVWVVFAVMFFFRKKEVKVAGQNIRFMTLVNLSASQAGVVWQTDEPAESYILYGPSIEALSERAEDVYSEKSGKIRKFHYAELKNLKPKTKYYFLIWDGKGFVGSTKDSPFFFTTPDYYLPAKTSPVVARISQGNKPAGGKLLFMQIKGFMPLAAISEPDGSFLFSLGLLFESSDLKRKVPSGREDFELRILEDAGKTIASGKLQGIIGYTGSLDITKEYSFFASPTQKKPAIVKAESREKTQEKKVFLSYPKEGAVISELNPLIRGTGVIGKDVVIQLKGPKVIVYRTIVDEMGDWWADITDPLPPGDYELVVRTVDEQNKEVEMTRNFSITKSGESVLGDATPEAGLTLTPTPTFFPTPTPTPQPTAAPVESDTTPTPPVSGFDFNTVAFSAIAAIIFAGILSFLKFRL